MEAEAATKVRVNNKEIKLYKRRWLLMAVFMVYTISCSLHWVEFSSISNIITRYYGVSDTAIEWTTMPFMVAYLLFVFPTLYIGDKMGVKNSLLLVGVGTSIGAIIKAFSISPDRFYILMIGQLFEAFFTVFTYGLVGRFTANWFASKEISTAGGLTMLGDQFGSALSFLIPNLLVEDSPDIEVVETGMMRMHITIAAFSIITAILIVLVFKEKPKQPPSFAQIRQAEEVQNVWSSIAQIFSKPSFLLMSTSYGLAIAGSSAFSTLLNQLIAKNFQDNMQDAGKIGFVFMLSGMICSMITSHVLDRTRNFKGNAVFLSLGATISWILFTVVLKLGNILLVYVASVLIGGFLLSYYSTGMQLGIEITYPVSEGITIASMSLFNQIISIVLTVAFGYVLKEYDDITANIGIICVLITSVICAILIPPDLEREKAEISGGAPELREFIPKN